MISYLFKNRDSARDYVGTVCDSRHRGVDENAILSINLLEIR